MMKNVKTKKKKAGDGASLLAWCHSPPLSNTKLGISGYSD